MTAVDSDRAEVLRFWRSVELFSPQQVPDRDALAHVYDLDGGSLAPWEVGHHARDKPLRAGMRWRHTVYCGVFKRDAAFELLRGVLRSDAESFDARPAKGDGALVAFAVSDEGRPMLDSVLVSSCAWAIGRALDPGPQVAGWLQGLEDAQEAFSEMFSELVAASDDDVSDGAPGVGQVLGRPIGGEVLLECSQRAIAMLGAEKLSAGGVRVASQILRAANADRAEEHDFLNSFIADDLAMVADEVEAGDYGAALRNYLASGDDVDEGARVDVEHCLDAVHAAVAPACVPLGRWPAKAEHALGLGQQLAVCSVTASLGESSGLFAVNGPPGTGKTTMLREVVADVIVQRAQQLAELASPQDAFVAKHRWKTGDYTRTVHEFKAQLTGFEMVVACATNAAAENISIEIPGVDAIDAQMIGEIDHFPELASRLLAAKRADAPGTATAAWALIAGCLGNRSNRQRFVSALWFPDNRKQPRRDDSSAQPAAAAVGEPAGLLEFLKSYQQAPQGQAWPDAVAAFTSALEVARELAADRSRAFDLLRDAAAIERDAALSSQFAAAAARALVDAQHGLAEQQQTAAARREEVDRGEQARRDHREFRPKVSEWLFSAGRRAMREWHTRDHELAAATSASETQAGDAEELTRQLERAAVAADREVGRTAAAAATATRREQTLRTELATARERFGEFFPDERWWKDRERRERQAPWIDAEWNTARTELFLAALRLHKAFVVATAKQMQQSLHGAIDIVTGSAPAGISESAALAAWQSLFFIVPVLSTSFASFARVFSHLGRESLGWLFIDEAGQCAAQQPAGAIWRSRRVLVVGDPLQLEPIITLSFAAQQAIRREHDVDEVWLPSGCSAQTLADRVSPLGTYRGAGSDAIWVGAPLNVHRRCDEPMFTIVNEIAYNCQMVNATAPRSRLKLPTTTWLDVVSSDADQHWIPAEGEKLSMVLKRLEVEEHDFAEVFVLTPFRQVANHRDLHAHRRRYPGITIGTVHTAQGREADVVILILGGNPARPRAKQWAAVKPNLLNVAVSRAKRRLYVIGNRSAWAQHPHFDVLADDLPSS